MIKKLSVLEENFLDVELEDRIQYTLKQLEKINIVLTMYTITELKKQFECFSTGNIQQKHTKLVKIVNDLLYSLTSAKSNLITLSEGFDHLNSEE